MPKTRTYAAVWPNRFLIDPYLAGSEKACALHVVVNKKTELSAPVNAEAQQKIAFCSFIPCRLGGKGQNKPIAHDERTSQPPQHPLSVSSAACAACALSGPCATASKQP